MNPKDKAKELVGMYMAIVNDGRYLNLEEAKNCSLIACDEVINHHVFYTEETEGDGWTDLWEEVKEEISKINEHPNP